MNYYQLLKHHKIDIFKFFVLKKTKNNFFKNVLKIEIIFYFCSFYNI